MIKHAPGCSEKNVTTSRAAAAYRVRVQVCCHECGAGAGYFENMRAPVGSRPAAEETATTAPDPENEDTELEPPQ